MLMKNNQGHTLLMVMLVLLMVTIIGTLAIRQSLVSLNVATNGQAQQLLLQNSDSAHFKFEEKVRKDPQLLDVTGMLGLITGKYRGDEMLFCYKGTQKEFFDLLHFGTFSLKGEDQQFADSSTTPSFSSSLSTQAQQGVCQLDRENDFTSGRKVVMTQISVISPEETIVNNDMPFAGQTRGTDSASSKLMPDSKIIINAVSLMPTLSRASTSQINQCLNNSSVYLENSQKSLTTCLTNLNVPFATYTTEYMLSQDFI
ncbi:Type IV fimbrial biogenesis protein PilX [Acinetobacter gerneri DSM 14967 = CIP 107464 = MTCC 9824]|nr:Type IV fimbrial biogenesis protein PilX [Acinetobacter gerneri DSM 14967 = CIP 107464 = MTCC 9824]